MHLTGSNRFWGLLQLRQQHRSSLHYDTSAGGQWITIGGAHDGDKKHAGGTPVKLDGTGRIAGGPAGLRGKHIGQVDQGKREKPAVTFPERKLELKPRPESKPTPKASQGKLFDTGGSAPRRGPGQMTPDQIQVDPHRFQYKISGIDPKTGVSKHLSDAKYNPMFAGQLLVWQDPQNGQTYVINGHHRHHLAKQSGYTGPMSVFHIDAGNAAEARAIGALANIAGGNGTAVDAAKFLRDTGTTIDDMKQHGVSISGAIARDAVPLANLHPDLFQGLTMGRIDQNRALAIARELPDQNLQKQLNDIVSKREAKTKKQIANSAVEEMAREMALAGTRKETSQDLFGSFTDEKSNFIERNELKAFIRRSLAEDKNAFKAVSKKKRNARLEEAGNVLDTEANAQHADLATKAIGAFNQLADLKGPLADLLNAAAAKYGTNPRQRASIFKHAFTNALTHIRAELGEPGTTAMDTPANGHGQQATATYSRSGTTTAGGYPAPAINPLAAAINAAFRAGVAEHYAIAWDEKKHPRDHGKFSSKPVAQGTHPSGKIPSPNKVNSTIGKKPPAIATTLKSTMEQMAPKPFQHGLKGGKIKDTKLPIAHDMATALGRGYDATAAIEQYVAQCRREGVDATTAYGHAQEALNHRFPPVNPEGHDTQARHKQADGNYTPQRKLLHDDIISKFMHGVQTGQSAPEVHFMGGGPAAGKSSVIDAGQVALPDSHVMIDPDQIKGELPDYKIGNALRYQPTAADAHEESSDVSKMLTATAANAKAHVVVDGTGDSGYKKMSDKVKAMKAQGYKAVANYVTVGTDEAWRRASARAEKTGRKVPEHVVRNTHRAVSLIVPQAIQEGLFDEMNVYDTDVPQGTNPIKIASAQGTNLQIHDQERWQRFIDKGKQPEMPDQDAK